MSHTVNNRYYLYALYMIKLSVLHYPGTIHSYYSIHTTNNNDVTSAFPPGNLFVEIFKHNNREGDVAKLVEHPFIVQRAVSSIPGRANEKLSMSLLVWIACCSKW